MIAVLYEKRFSYFCGKNGVCINIFMIAVLYEKRFSYFCGKNGVCINTFYDCSFI